MKIGKKEENKFQNQLQSRRINRNGFTLVEIIVVIVIVAILAAVAIPSLIGYIDKSHRAEDLISLRTLNMGTKLYRVNEQVQTSDVFAEETTDLARQNRLLEGVYIEEIMVPRAKNNYFVWDKSMQIWCGASTPLGRPFESVADAMAKYKETTNNYGPTWGGTSGDANYTDIGLDPDIWKDKPVDHIYYTPVGSYLKIQPEKNYKIKFDFSNGNTGTLNHGGWNIIYNLLDSTWYYHSIAEGNQIDIDSVKVVPN